MEQLNQHTEPENSERKVIETDLENLHIYKQARLALAAQLRIVQEGLKVPGKFYWF